MRKLDDAGIADEQLRALIAKLPVDDKARLMAGLDGRFTGEAPEVGLSRMSRFDGPSGIGARSGPEDFPLLTPCPAALAASWDRDLVRQVGEVIGDEALRRDVQVVHAPNVNLPRSPLGGATSSSSRKTPGSREPWHRSG